MRHGFVYLSFTKQIILSYLHYNCISTFNDTKPVSRVYKKTQFALVEKIKSFVVFKMRRGQLVVISSDEEDEVSMSKKPKLEESFVPNRDVFFIMKIIPGDGHCIVDILGESESKF